MTKVSYTRVFTCKWPLEYQKKRAKWTSTRVFTRKWLPAAQSPSPHLPNLHFSAAGQKHAQNQYFLICFGRFSGQSLAGGLSGAKVSNPVLKRQAGKPPKVSNLVLKRYTGESFKVSNPVLKKQIEEPPKVLNPLLNRQAGERPKDLIFLTLFRFREFMVCLKVWHRP